MNNPSDAANRRNDASNDTTAGQTGTTEVRQQADHDALNLALDLLRATPTGALGTLDPADGSPFSSLVTVATDLDGTPIILISALSVHTQALMADERCSLLLARSGRGDPLAHPRITLTTRAHFIDKDSDDGQRVAHRFLTRHAKASLYAGFADFSFVRLELVRASLNGGFGKAYDLAGEQLLCPPERLAGFNEAHGSVVAHMNDDHESAVQHYATTLCGQVPADWRMTGVDPYGIDMASSAGVCRLQFDTPLSSASEIRSVLVALAQQKDNT